MLIFRGVHPQNKHKQKAWTTEKNYSGPPKTYYYISPIELQRGIILTTPAKLNIGPEK